MKIVYYLRGLSIINSRLWRTIQHDTRLTSSSITFSSFLLEVNQHYLADQNLSLHYTRNSSNKFRRFNNMNVNESNESDNDESDNGSDDGHEFNAMNDNREKSKGKQKKRYLGPPCPICTAGHLKENCKFLNVERSTFQCFHCKKTGHFSPECSQRPKSKKDQVEKR